MTRTYQRLKFRPSPEWIAFLDRLLDMARSIDSVYIGDAVAMSVLTGCRDHFTCNARSLLVAHLRRNVHIVNREPDVCAVKHSPVPPLGTNCLSTVDLAMMLGCDHSAIVHMRVWGGRWDRDLFILADAAASDQCIVPEVFHFKAMPKPKYLKITKHQLAVQRAAAMNRIQELELSKMPETNVELFQEVIVHYRGQRALGAVVGIRPQDDEYCVQIVAASPDFELLDKESPRTYIYAPILAPSSLPKNPPEPWAEVRKNRGGQMTKPRIGDTVQCFDRVLGEFSGVVTYVFEDSSGWYADHGRVEVQVSAQPEVLADLAWNHLTLDMYPAGIGQTKSGNQWAEPR